MNMWEAAAEAAARMEKAEKTAQELGPAREILSPEMAARAEKPPRRNPQPAGEAAATEDTAAAAAAVAADALMCIQTQQRFSDAAAPAGLEAPAETARTGLYLFTIRRRNRRNNHRLQGEGVQCLSCGHKRIC